MTCRDFAEFIADYRDGELPSAERAVFDAHLAACDNCRRYLAIYENTVGLGRRAFDDPAAPLPPDLPSQLAEAILAARRLPPAE